LLGAQVLARSRYAVHGSSVRLRREDTFIGQRGCYLGTVAQSRRERLPELIAEAANLGCLLHGENWRLSGRTWDEID